MKKRTMDIAKFLNRERMASYKETAEALGLSERSVRYDVDAINDELHLKGLAQIERYPKGMLFLPDDLDLTELFDEESYIFTNEERASIIRLLILFDTKKLNISSMSRELQVSRRSIQNDIAAVEQEFAPYGIRLHYERKFRISEDPLTSYGLRQSEIQKSVTLLYKKHFVNVYEKTVCPIVRDMIAPPDLSRILEWIRGMMDEMQWVLSDETFQWYVSSVLTFTWYVVRNKPLPLKGVDLRKNSGGLISRYEEAAGLTLTDEQKSVLAGYEKYTNKYVNLDLTQNLISVEDTAVLLVREMERTLGVSFSKDGILMKGLLNHIGPMLQRLESGEQLDNSTDSFIPESYDYVYQNLDKILKRDRSLSELTENEAVYLAIFFIGSLRRMKSDEYRTLLLICGYGYGTTAVVKDALINEYQVQVYKCIPAYRVENFDEWDSVDAVVSTVGVELPVDKPFAKVNVIFDRKDYEKLDNLGLTKKKILTEYFAIERRLGFLNAADKNRVMDVIKEELGYKEVRMPQKYYSLSDLLRQEDIRIIERAPDWREAVDLCTGPLISRGGITPEYRESVMRGIQAQGFYAVTDEKFALLHGSERAGVTESAMSLLISREPVQFGDKQVNLIFCLASRDKKEHIPAVISLIRMMSRTSLLEDLKAAGDPQTAMNMIKKHESEVENAPNFE